MHKWFTIKEKDHKWQWGKFLGLCNVSFQWLLWEEMKKVHSCSCIIGTVVTSVSLDSSFKFLNAVDDAEPSGNSMMIVTVSWWCKCTPMTAAPQQCHHSSTDHITHISNPERKVFK